MMNRTHRGTWKDMNGVTGLCLLSRDLSTLNAALTLCSALRVQISAQFLATEGYSERYFSGYAGRNAFLHHSAVEQCLQGSFNGYHASYRLHASN